MVEKYCRYCGKELKDRVVDLGLAPLSNDYLAEEDIKKGQYVLPLQLYVCSECKLVQVTDYEMPDRIFNEEYKYYSSYSTSWLEHSKRYVDMIIDRLGLTNKSKIFEVAANDGYLLQYFLAKGFEPVGIEPSASTAAIAKAKGIDMIIDFFNENLAKELHNGGQDADLIIGNNVLAHVPDIGGFVSALKILLKERGTITIEFPHFLNLIRLNQFDTIYHEHFSCLTMLAVNRVFDDCDLKIYDVEKLTTHGGSLRIYATHKENQSISISDSVRSVIAEEKAYGLAESEVYSSFQHKVEMIKLDVLQTLIELKREGKTVCGYGAAAKGNTLFNYCGVGPELVTYAVDANPHKQGMFLPGSLIPIYEPDYIKKNKPDYVIIIPWNIKDEISEQLSYIREWGGMFITFIPEVSIF